MRGGMRRIPIRICVFHFFEVDGAPVRSVVGEIQQRACLRMMGVGGALWVAVVNLNVRIDLIPRRSG